MGVIELMVNISGVMMLQAVVTIIVTSFTIVHIVNGMVFGSFINGVLIFASILLILNCLVYWLWSFWFGEDEIFKLLGGR